MNDLIIIKQIANPITIKEIGQEVIIKERFIFEMFLITIIIKMRIKNKKISCLIFCD
tara:strand:- start:159 stop:329 length:171 start_codon:yes stop_codon:yes gene_type:complete